MELRDSAQTVHTRRWLTIVKYGGVFLLFLGALAGVRWAWTLAFETVEGPPAVGGVLDLRGQGIESAPIFLDGEWSFYPGKLLSGAGTRPEPASVREIQVPGNWIEAVADDDGAPAYGYGTYRLLIRTDPLERPIALWLNGIEASSEVEINGVPAGRSGHPAVEAGRYTPLKKSYVASYYAAGETELEVLIRVANFDKPHQGGLLQSIRYGPQDVIERMRGLSMQFQVGIFFILLLHGLYACILLLIHQDRTLLYMAMLVAAVGLLIVSGYDQVLLDWLPLNYTLIAKLRLILFLWQNTLLLLIFRRLLQSPPQRVVLWALMLGVATMTVCLLLGPEFVVLSSGMRLVVIVLGLVPIVWLLPVLLRLIGKLRNDRDLWFLLLTASGFLANLGWRALQSGETYSGLYYPVDVLVTIIGFSTYWFSKYFRNARENAKLNEKLKREDALKDQFLANTSHELRTPLHGIRNIVQAVADRQQPDRESKEDLERVIQISRRMSHMLDNLLDMARLKEERIQLHRERLSIQAILPGVLGMLRLMLEGKPIELRMAVPASLPPVLGDEERLVQVLYNLVHNAIKYTAQGSITVSAAERDGKVRIEVADTGIGMDEATMQRIFLPYEQAEIGRRDGRGLGLGLSICQQLVERHGGELTVRSKLGEGSTFAFELPVAEASGLAAEAAAGMADERLRASGDERLRASGDELPAHQAASGDMDDPAGATGDLYRWPEEEPSGGRLHILTVDDDPVNLGVLSRMLGDRLYEVKGVTSGEEALLLLEGGGWDILITDVMMPGMSGYELTERVRERHSELDLPVLLLTARGQPADIYTGFRAGANDYLTKPVDPVELRFRVRAIASIKHAMQERLRLEAAYLQAQIQPHFLFNTLNSIASLVHIDTERMALMIDAFASYLRISFDYLNTGELAVLSRELELVESYLYIEKERFGDRLTIVWEVDASIGVLLPPLSIQPLVENAVRHGLLRKAAGGTLRIRVSREADGVLVEVEDDGVGIEEQEVHRLLGPTRRERAGIGVANTHRRLIQLYGKGLTIVSSLGNGTKVSFVIPGGQIVGRLQQS